MISTANALIQVRDIIYADSELQKWCKDNYGKEASVYLGFDDDDKEAPQSSDFPVVQIYNISRIRGADKHRDVFDVEISIQIENTEKISVSNGLTYTGFLDAGMMRDLVENALYKSRIANIDSVGASATFSNFPEFEAVTKIRITLIADQRSGISNRL